MRTPYACLCLLGNVRFYRTLDNANEHERTPKSVADNGFTQNGIREEREVEKKKKTTTRQ